jgi:hypothetical protein
MSYLFDLRTVSTPQIVAKDAPKRIPPAMSYAEMAADAKAARARQRKAWGEGMFSETKDKPSRDRRTQWMPERMAKLRAQIIATLTKHGPMTSEDLLARVRVNRHKLRDTLTELRKEGLIKRTMINRLIYRWGVA